MGRRLSYELNDCAYKIELWLRVGPKRELVRSEVIQPGNTYKIEPDNPQKLKNRGRTCIVTELIRNDIFQVDEAKVKFLDNNKNGIIDIRELISI